MKFSKLTLAIATTLGASASFSAFAIELYVDTKTKQIYAEPGRGRELMGSFEKVGDAPAKTAAPVAAPAEIAAVRQDLEMKTNEIKALQEHAAEAEKIQVKMDADGFEVKSKDGNFKTKLGGRLQVDSQVNSNDNGPHGTNLANGVGIRRGRIYTEGSLFKDYEYRFEYDFARNNGGTQGITDAYVKYVAFKPFAITIGQQSEGKSMESVMSNNYLTFIERGLPNNALIEQGSNSKYQLGAIASTYDKVFERPYTLQAGITTESFGAPGPGNSSDNSQGGANAAGGTNANGTNTNRNAFSGNTSYQIVSRGTILPYKDDRGNLIHAGAWGSWRSINNNFNPDGTLRTGGWQFASQPDSNVDRTNWINTGNLTTARTAANPRIANNVSMVGAELAGAFGPTHFQAEYMQATVSGQGYSSDTVRGFDISGGWFLTGESRPYDEKKGTWGRVKPKSNFIGGHGTGAVEIAARFDLMDMNTQHIRGGSIDAGTLAVNWYLTPRLRFMTDWVHVFGQQSTNGCAATSTSTFANGFPNQGSSAGVGCFNGLSPDIIETRLSFDY
jgi:phosphate-selective porin OprO and OprP